MATNPRKLVIFDCDGTLTDSEHMNKLATCALLAEQGLSQYDEAYAERHMVGKSFNQSLADIAAETGHVFPDDMPQRYVERVRQLASSHLKAIAGANDLVQAVSGKAAICVASNGQRENVLLSLRLTGLLDYFEADHVFTAAQAARPKPFPDLFLFAADNMGCAPGHTIVIEDSVEGVRAGVAAGMRVIGFSGSSADPAQAARILADAGAFAVHDSLIHIREALFEAGGLL